MLIGDWPKPLALKSESARMDLLYQAVSDTAYLLWKVLPAMFIGLFGVEVLVRLGLMRKLEAVGAPPWRGFPICLPRVCRHC